MRKNVKEAAKDLTEIVGNVVSNQASVSIVESGKVVAKIVPAVEKSEAELSASEPDNYETWGETLASLR